MGDSLQYVGFLIEGRRYALPLHAVERVVRAVEVTPLPAAPLIVLGVIEIGGTVLPVLSLRRRFGFPDREIVPSDYFIVAHTRRRGVTLVVEEVEGIIECPEATIIAPEQIVPGLEHVEGVVQLEEGLVLIHDLEKFLSLDEEQALSNALKAGAQHES